MVGLGGIGRGQALAALVKARETPAPGGNQMNQVAAKQVEMTGGSTVPGAEINNNQPAGGFGGSDEFGGDSSNKPQSRQTSCRRCGQEGHFARDCPNSQQQEGNFGGGFNSGAKQSGGGFGGGFGAKQQGGSGGNGCRICNEDGHFARDCSKKTAGGGACRVCNEEGHFARECPNKPAGSNACRVCNEEGHFARECPNKPADSNTCRYCKEEGHMVRDCQNKPAGGNACRFCNEDGHFARECPSKPAQKCHNCDKEGHMARECPEPRRSREDSEFPPPADYVPEEVDEEKLFEQLPIRTGVHFSQIFDIAVQRTGKTEAQFPPIETFASIALPDVVRVNIQKAGYEVPTPVQRHCIPLIAAGLDLMGFAQTGSGKTAAFLLPIIHSLVAKGDTGKLDDKLAPSAIILAPTRELARQIHSDARMLAHGTDIPIAILYGGTKVAHQQMLLMRGCTILVATPGRLLHFIDKSHLVVDKCRFLVLDEADRMLDEGFGPDVRKLIEMTAMPDKQSRQTLMFSATFEESVQQLAREMLKPEFVFVAVGIIGGACLDITQSFLRVPQTEKKDKLMELLRLDIEKYEKREEEPYTKKTLVFVERKRTADVVASFLSQESLPAISIHGDRGQQLREEALRMFTSGECPVLVATAVAARGLDIKGVDHVINYDLPQTQEDYVHRIGRTGRIGNLGRATSFFDVETDHSLADKLVQVLSDAQQVVPEWLANQAGVGGVSGYGDRTDFGSDAQKTNDAWGTDDQKPSTAAVNGDPQW